jgi:hypothetical protein
MEENWYAVEQQVRDRLNEARAAARTRALIQKRARTARRPNSLGITIIRLENWVLACAMQLAKICGWRSESERSFECRHRRALRMRQHGPWDKDAVEVTIENLAAPPTSTVTFL